MKKFFILAVVLSSLCSSCETADESFLTGTNNESTFLQKSNSVVNTDYETYTNIVNSFEYHNKETYMQNVQRFEQYVNHIMQSETEGAVYDTIDSELLSELSNAVISSIDQLNYSTAFKEALYNMLNKKEPQAVRILKNKDENRLLNTLVIMHNDNDENSDDDKWNNKKRTIAFAYGAQYSLKQAVLYAGAIELSAK